MRSPRTAMKSSPRSPQLEKSPRAATKTQHSQKKKKKKKSWELNCLGSWAPWADCGAPGHWEGLGVHPSFCAVASLGWGQGPFPLTPEPGSGQLHTCFSALLSEPRGPGLCMHFQDCARTTQLCVKLALSFLPKDVDVHYVSFRCSAQWCDACICYEMIPTISLVTLCPHTKAITIITDRIPYAVYYMPCLIL